MLQAVVVRRSLFVQSARAQRQHASTALPQDPNAFFNRERECKVLQKLLRTKPEAPIVVSGPADCGKTALICEVTKDMRTKVYFNMRQEDCSSPNSFMETLADQLRKLMLIV